MTSCFITLVKPVVVAVLHERERNSVNRQKSWKTFPDIRERFFYENKRNYDH